MSNFTRRVRKRKEVKLKIDKNEIDKELERIAFRYERIEKGFPENLQLLLSNKKVKDILIDFRNDGFKDWHIMHALENVIYSQYFTNPFEMMKTFKENNYVGDEAINYMKKIDNEFTVNLERIDSEDLKIHMMSGFSVNAARYGFQQPKGVGIQGEEIMKNIKKSFPFLFELDVQHKQIF